MYLTVLQIEATAVAIMHELAVSVKDINMITHVFKQHNFEYIENWKGLLTPEL